MSMVTADGLSTMVRINARTGWKSLAAWVLGLVAMMVATAASITALYDTPAELRGYADSVGGDAMLMLNGKVAGIGSLGGVVANEFGFILSFGLPVMGIALTARGTRKDEEAGRLELLLAARIGRHAPLLAAVLVATGALLVTGLGCSVAMIAVGVDAGPAVLYGLGIAALGFVFVGVTAVAAQVFEHTRSVWGIGLAAAVIGYLLRGLGASQDSALLWLSPHGWIDEIRPFGDSRWWPLLLAVTVGVALTVTGFWLSTRRDVGSALIQPRSSRQEASAFLRTPVGLAWYEHRGSILGWTIGAGVLMATYGSLMNEVLDAIRDNPALGQMLGADPGAADRLLSMVLSTFLMMLAMVVVAFVLAAIGSLRGEEDTGRLEGELSGQRSRWSWLGVHVAVVAVGAGVVGLAGAGALAWSAAASTGDDAWIGEILSGSLAYLPAVSVFFGLVVLIFGIAPRLRGLGWAVFAVAAVVGYLGPGFDFPDWVVYASPFQAVGSNVLADGLKVVGGVALISLAMAWLVLGFLGFARRDIPRS